jgi:hypothetical protein
LNSRHQVNCGVSLCGFSWNSQIFQAMCKVRIEIQLLPSAQKDSLSQFSRQPRRMQFNL